MNGQSCKTYFKHKIICFIIVDICNKLYEQSLKNDANRKDIDTSQRIKRRNCCIEKSIIRLFQGDVVGIRMVLLKKSLFSRE